MEWRLLGIMAGIVVAAAGMVWAFGVGVGLAWTIDPGPEDTALYIHYVPPLGLFLVGAALFAVSMTARDRSD